MGEAFLGVDVGTGSARAGVFDGDGRLLASARRPIRIWRDSGEIVEHSSTDIWAAACSAVREATQHRMRPIMLTAGAATLELIPISREIFWGPMAYAMMGGIIVGTMLTLLFLPALYLAWFRIPKPEAVAAGPATAQKALAAGQ